VLTVVDQSTRECLLLLADSSVTGQRVALALSLVVAERGAQVSITVNNVLRPSRDASGAKFSCGLAKQAVYPGFPFSRWISNLVKSCRALDKRGFGRDQGGAEVERRWVRHRLALPARVDSWSLTSLQQRLVKTGGRLIKHARYYWLLLAEGHLTRRLFAGMLRGIATLSSPAG
jgi:putative transposase